MAEHVTATELRTRLEAPDLGGTSPFQLLADIAAVLGEPDVAEGVGRDLVIRALDRRALFEPVTELLNSLVRRVGLFPYTDEGLLGDADLVAREFHRPIGRDVEQLVFHTEQARVYRRLLDGDNLILSASTSFGKSLIIDAILATGYYTNCVVVVPTIALLDETRRRLSRYPYKVVTHASQRPADRNVFVMTQERLLDYPDLPQIDFFAIDEFYKLDPSTDPDRSLLLNQAFYRLLKTGAQFYLLGPNIRAIPPDLDIDAGFVQTSYRTVALDISRLAPADDEQGSLIELCQTLTEPTIIFCKSPARTREVTRWLLDAGLVRPTAAAQAAGRWASSAYDTQWVVAEALSSGIGIHHGRLPRGLAHLIVDLFNRTELRFLVCTSTLIEGVNTAAKNVVVFDNRIAARRFDFFTYNNIRGRSGRMFRHFVGNVFLFHPPPTEELPFVDFPALTQGEDVPPELLMQLEPEDLLPRSRDRVARFERNDVLDPEVLRENIGIDLEAQIRVAAELRDSWAQLSPLLGWRGLPTYDQFVATCEYLWALADGDGRSNAVRSHKQLALLTWRLRATNGNARAFIQRQAAAGRNPSDTVEDALEFIRLWPGHHLPKLLLALQRIEEAVVDQRIRRPGDYRLFAGQAEHLFMPPFAAALEEYGIPAGISLKVPELFRRAEGLDDVLDRLRDYRPDQRLTPFEASVVRDATEGL